MVKEGVPLGPEGTCTYLFDATNKKWMVQASSNPGDGCSCPEVLMGHPGAGGDPLTVPAICGNELAKVNAIADPEVRRKAAAAAMAPGFAKAGKPLDLGDR